MVAGWLIHLFCFGLVVSSCWEYMGTDSFRQSTKRMKLMVATVMLSELTCVIVTITQICIASISYGLAQDRDLPTIFFVARMDAVPFAVSGTTGAIVQLFLIRRASFLFISRPLGRKAFRYTASLASVLGWLAAVGTTVMYALAVSFQNTFLSFNWVWFTNILLSAWLWTSLLVDWIVAVTLCLLLRKHIAGFSDATDNMLRRIVALSIRTAIFPAIFATGGALTAVIFPRSSITTVNISFAFVYPLPSLYTLAFLSTLRARESTSATYAADKSRSLAAFAAPSIYAPPTSSVHKVPTTVQHSAPRMELGVELGEEDGGSEETRKESRWDIERGEDDR